MMKEFGLFAALVLAVLAIVVGAQLFAAAP